MTFERVGAVDQPIQDFSDSQVGIVSTLGELPALVTDYLTHARFEEAQFLPLAQRSLGRNSHHMAALGSSQHIRHASHEIQHKFGFI